jgi:hypothetical protein
MVLFDEGVAVFRIKNYRDIFKETRYHVRIKILNKKGLDYANIKIRYPTSNKLIDVINIRAQTYNLDATGNIVETKVEKSAIYDKKINKRYAEKIFAFPDVKEGSVIEYE